MPIYSYKCLKCECTFEIFHSMSETQDVCKVCSAPGELQKLPPKNTNISKTRNTTKPKVGALVNQHIKDAKQEVKREKNLLKSKEYKK